MFTLRRITNNNIEINTILGIEYTVITKELSKDQFDNLTSEWTDDDLKDVYGIVTLDSSESIIPLYLDESYFIMTSDGKTFSNLSKK